MADFTSEKITAEKFDIGALVSAATLRGIMMICCLVVGNSRGQERRAAPRVFVNLAFFFAR